MLFSGKEQEDSRELDRLIAATAAGNHADFETLYRRTSASVYGFALSILKNSHEAEEVSQKVYLTLYSRAGRYESQGKPMAWILTITRNLCLMRLRNAKKEESIPPEEMEGLLTSSGFGDAKEKGILLTAAMERLDDKERQIVILHAVGGLLHREIAEILELPLPTVLSKYRRSLAKLKKILKEGPG